MNKIIQKIINMLFPEKTSCVVCNADLNHCLDSNVCAECESNFEKLNQKICEVCNEPIYSMSNLCLRCKNKKHTFKIARAPFAYTNKVRALVSDLKFDNKKYIAKTMAYYIAECYKQNNFCCDIIVPVPMHANKFKKRGYNQCDLIGGHLSKLINIPLVNDSLVKHVDTKTQVDLSHHERCENLLNAFSVANKKNIKGKTVLLIDDVYTTGSTVENCSVALKKAGATKIYVICFAHTVLNQ